MNATREMNENVVFSDEFKRRVLYAIGQTDDIKHLLNTNSYSIGRCINDNMESCRCGCTRDINTHFGRDQIELVKLYDVWGTYFFVEPYEEVII